MGENQRGKVYALTELFLIGSLYVDQASLQLMIFLPQSPKCKDYSSQARLLTFLNLCSLNSERGPISIPSQGYL